MDNQINENSKKNKRSINAKWLNFQVLSPTSAILRGSYSINDKHFKFQSRGKQATACAIIAIILTHLLKPEKWTKSHVNQILEYGDKLFRISQTRNQIDPSVYMTTQMIYPEFYFGDYKCLISTESSKIYGNLFTESVGCPDFTEGLQRFFKIHNYGIITAQGTSVAMWYDQTYGYFLFDPVCCTESGSLLLATSTASIVRFKCMNDMLNYFLNNSIRKYDSRYCIDKISVLRITPVNRFIKFDKKLKMDNRPDRLNNTGISKKRMDCTKTIPKTGHSAVVYPEVINREPLSVTISNYSIDRKVVAEPMINQNFFDTGYRYDNVEVNVPSTFKELEDNTMILHGWTHEGSDMYKGKGAQNVANCIMSIAMKKKHPVRSWLRKTLDEVLVLGDGLYIEAKTANPNAKSFNASDFDNLKIQVEDKKMFINVDLMTVVGTLVSKNPSIPNLEQGLEEFFTVHKDGIIECTARAIAIWKDEDSFYTFDPRQCDAMGIRVIESKEKSGGKGGKNVAGPVEKKINGKCCVMRFSSINKVLVHYFKNTDPNKKNERFIIRSITIMDDLPGLQPWYEFQPFEPKRTWILQGTIANDAEEFEDETRGVQGLAIPTLALVNATEIPPNIWTRDTVDETIREGDDYFTWCIPPEEENNRELILERLKKILYVKNRQIKISIVELSVIGNLETSPESQIAELTKKINQFFEVQQFGLLEIKNLAIALWKFEEELKDKTKLPAYYYFHQYPGIKVDKSKSNEMEEELGASIVRALDVAELARLIVANVDAEAEGTNEFFIHAFQVVSIGEILSDAELENIKKLPVKPELNAYTEMSENSAYLNGSFDQSNNVFFKTLTRDKQQAANALVTLAMRQLYNPHLWYQDVVDDILKLGDKLTQANIANIAEIEDENENEGRRNYLLPIEIQETFNIGVNKVTVTVEEEKSRGAVPELSQLLEEFFVETPMGILRQLHVMLPIWKEGDVYFTMDPRSRENKNGSENKNGAASVFWFTTIDSLSAALFESLANSQDDLIIDGIILDNEFESRVIKEQPKSTVTEESFYNYSKKRDGIWELAGTISISDERFDKKNRGKQSAAVAVISVIFSKIYEPHQWTIDIINEIVITGDKLYEKSAFRLGDSFELSVNQIITEFFLSNRRLNLIVSDCVEAGNITGKQPKVPDLKTGIENYFEKYSCGILTISNTVNIAIWKSDNRYHCVISNTSLNNPEEISPKATIIRFKTIELFCNYVKEIFDNDDYEISAIEIIDWDKLPPWKYDPSSIIPPANLPPLNAFKRTTGSAASAILSGSIHQGSEIFSPEIRNQQTAANCIVALGMSVIRDPVTWTKKTMDEILVIGNNVCRETMKFLTTVKRLKPVDIVRVFHVGTNVLTADVDDSTVTGIVAKEPPKPEIDKKDKGKAKKKPEKAGKKKGKQKRVPPPPPPPIMLVEGLAKFFEKNRAGVLATGRFMIALWKDQGVYFLYDPRSRDINGLREDSGTACTMWFACMEPLYDLIFSNIEESEKYGQYTISRVIIKTTIMEALPSPVGFQSFSNCASLPVSLPSVEKSATIDVVPEGEFHIVDEELSVLSGTISMNDQIFPTTTRGLQSTAMAAVAIVMALLHVPSTWTSATIDCILKSGDILYRDSVRMAGSGARNLSPSELLTVFIVGDVKATVHIHHHTVAGIVQLQDLTEALTLFFKNYCAGILHTANLAIAVMQHCGKFYMFDSSARNKNGQKTYNGTACAIKCENIMRMAWIFVANCNYKIPSVYTLNAVDVWDFKFLMKSQICSTICGI